MNEIKKRLTIWIYQCSHSLTLQIHEPLGAIMTRPERCIHKTTSICIKITEQQDATANLSN